MQTVFIKTLGCKVNAFDSHALSFQLRQNGFQLSSKLLQPTRTNGVKRSHQATACCRREMLDTLPHLIRGAVSESYRQYVPRRNAVIDQRGNTSGDDAGLAAARASKNHRLPISILHRLLLGLVESQSNHAVFQLVYHFPRDGCKTMAKLSQVLGVLHLT